MINVNEKIKGSNDLLMTIFKLENFDDPNNLELKKIFFQISENKDFDILVRDFATDLMLYCEGDELGVLTTLDKNKIIKKATMTLGLESWLPNCWIGRVFQRLSFLGPNACAEDFPLFFRLTTM